ncbi:mannose-1-phosphate guanylyltransferase [Sulfitobacter marinus]|uniref:Mannose-1-phosphate guanylyltransferase n=1 Tax=Sulfitobacter marinus TaxID=394264 RepID=A0A1I6T4W5_9RHOB|nr:nucleotidyltransferase family protein [Sulfitobacter marinus]SFS84078.1 mannose-1-phosphate guanylyltransferase [Sulfitobacter marinus]
MRDTPKSVMMFAAGFGTRMRHLTQDQPKPMIKVAGRPLIDHALDLANAIAPDRIVANLHYKPEPLLAHLKGRNVRTIVETPDILETGGGLRNALPLLGTGSVFTMNTDAIWAGPNPLTMLQDVWNPDIMDALLIGIPPAQAVGHSGKGDFVMGQCGQLTRGPGVIYGGVQIIKTDLLKTIPDRAFSLNLLWDKMLTMGRIYGVRYTGKWCDVGHPEGITLAENMLRGAHV